MNNYLVAIAAVALYSVATALLVHKLREHSTSAGSRLNGKRSAMCIAVIAMILHAIVTAHQTGLPSSLSLPFFTALSVTMLAIVIVQLTMCITSPADYLGLVIYPLASLCLFISVLFQGEAKALSSAVETHVLLSVMAYAVLALCAAQAALVSVQRRYLNNHQPGGFIRALPPLTSTESMLFSLLGVGFVLLTLSLASGFAFLDDMFAQQVVHKTFLSCLAWLIFAVLLGGRWRFGWRGQRVVFWTLAGFATLLVAYFGSKLVLELILQR